MDEEKTIAVVGGRSSYKRMLSTLLMMNMALGSEYAIDPLGEASRKMVDKAYGNAKRRSTAPKYCHTCTIKKSDPAYCRKCRSEEL